MFRYTRMQVLLHWAVVALLLLQYLFNEPIGEAFERWMREGTKTASLGVVFHIVVGFTVLVLALWRLALHRTAPRPPAPATAAERVGFFVHLALYGLLLALPVAGGVAWLTGSEAAAEVHEVLTTVLLVVAGLHVVGALYHQIVLKDGLLARMSLH